MGQATRGQVWLVLAALVGTFVGAAGIASAREGAQASLDAAASTASTAAPPAKSERAKSAPAKAAASGATGDKDPRVNCSEAADQSRAGTAVVGAIVGGIIGAVVISAINAESISKREALCLRMKGDPQAMRQEEARLKAQSAQKAETRRASASASSSRSVAPSGTTCACKQMTTCTGSWATLTCSQLTERCRNPRTPRVYVENGCDRLKELVGHF